MPSSTRFSPEVRGQRSVKVCEAVGGCSSRLLGSAPEALVRAVEPRTLIMHAGGVATPEDAGEIVRAGAAGTGATSAIINARDRGKVIEGFLGAVRQAFDGALNLSEPARIDSFAIAQSTEIADQ